MTKFKDTLEICRQLAFDLHYTHAKKWVKEKEGRALVGFMPVYFPREIAHAVDALAVGIYGVGDRKQVVKGDAYYQSYICRIPRGIVELALDGYFNEFDGFVFPSICDVIRNLSGMFQLLKAGKFTHYLDYPQNFLNHIGGKFYQKNLEEFIHAVTKINHAKLTTEKLNHSISLFNKNRKMLNEIYDIRTEFPWRLSAEDLYYIVRAGQTIPIEEHNEMLGVILEAMREEIGEPMDKIKVVVSGSFCEQPPVGLIKTIENAGCYIIDDDFIIGARWIIGDINDSTDNPLSEIANAFIHQSTFASSVYDVGNPKEKRLLQLVEERKVDGVIFAAPSFCDPALLDAPIFQQACDKAGVRYVSFQYSENTGQFKNIKEQVGAFSDSIKLWGDDVEVV